MENITLNHICKSFDGRILFNDLNLVLKAGQTTCIMGVSGIGKTTLARMLMGLDRPDSGSISGIDGLRISAVFQEDRLCESLSASANAAIALKGGVGRSVSDGILKALGLENDLLKPVSDLSGGMRRRVAIARALCAEYDLLIMDEPFTGLDPDARNRTIECILRCSKGKTLLLITHDRDVPAIMGGNVLDLAACVPLQM